jgi:hypothetical protein
MVRKRDAGRSGCVERRLADLEDEREIRTGMARRRK